MFSVSSAMMYRLMSLPLCANATRRPLNSLALATPGTPARKSRTVKGSTDGVWNMSVAPVWVIQ